ncbi:MAG: hypothetical protein H0V37_00545, partial [Chloroflexia bacterium]|nr:hypothetical protein [Chloroflexia bacterium]
MIADGSVPQALATSSTPVSASRRDTPHLRRPWYRRPWRVIPFAVLILLTIVGGVIGYRTLAAFDTEQSLSTPPPELNGAALGGDPDTVIDTGPAQAAVQRRQARELAQNEPGNAGVAPTEPESGNAALDTSTEPAVVATMDGAEPT